MNKRAHSSLQVFFALSLLTSFGVAFLGCGSSPGSSGSSSGSATTYAITGTDVGLITSGLVISDGTDMIPVGAANGNQNSFSFPTDLPSGAAYDVTIVTQPTGLTCQVSPGTGSGVVGNSAVTTIVISCPSPWVWQGGSAVALASGIYGTLGVAAAGNMPGGRNSLSTWTDSSGNFWLFGGVGFDSAGTDNDLNDLWRFAPASGQWTWMGGSMVQGAAAVYGQLGFAAAGNVPGARDSSASWTDAQGNFWLLGGADTPLLTQVTAVLNDFWEFSPQSNLWTWMGGSMSSDVTGSYGVLGQAAAGNMPGARYSATTWVVSGMLWLFGGVGYDSAGTLGLLNDLWMFNPGTNQWTWISGSNMANGVGNYGMNPAPPSIGFPGARFDAVGWADAGGNLWLFGGVLSTGMPNDEFNDLWKFDPLTGVWTWMAGSPTAGAEGIYGTLGTGSTANVPGGRFGANAWVDGAGNFWLFGGFGVDAAQNVSWLGDLWQYSPATGQWTWENGYSTANSAGVYGSLGQQGANDPGTRAGAGSWVDSAGNLWLFGGSGFDSAGNGGALNDLWEFVQ